MQMVIVCLVKHLQEYKVGGYNLVGMPSVVVVSSQANIRNTFFDQKSPQLPEGGVLRWRRQTDRPTNSLAIL